MDRSLSRGYRRALTLLDNPRKFVEEVALLLGRKGDQVRTWAGALSDEELKQTIDVLSDGGIKDEWEFLFAIQEATYHNTHKPLLTC